MTNDSMKEKNEKMNNKNKGKVFYGNDCCEVRTCSHINIPKSELTEFVRLLQTLGQAILVQYGSGCLGGGTTGLLVLKGLNKDLRAIQLRHYLSSEFTNHNFRKYFGRTRHIYK